MKSVTIMKKIQTIFLVGVILGSVALFSERKGLLLAENNTSGVETNLPLPAYNEDNPFQVANLPARVGETPITLEIAATEPERILGLSFRLFLPENQGLLFVFPESDFHGIWMRKMRFPIDIIWLDDNLKIVDMAREVSPESFP